MNESPSLYPCYSQEHKNIKWMLPACPLVLPTDDNSQELGQLLVEHLSILLTNF